MSSPAYFHNIKTYLFNFADELGYSNSVGLGDLNIFAENLSKNLLNEIFGWELINANEKKRNQRSYDLVSESRGIYIQVTADKNHKKKYNDSVTAFKEIGICANHFIVFFISKKVNANLLEQKTLDGVIYEAYDLSKFLDVILYRCTEPKKLRLINDILADWNHPQLYNSISKSDLKIPFQKVNEVEKGIYIHRADLIKTVFDFVQEKNGLLVGGPGFGKSFLLEELSRYCSSRSIPCFIIRINDLTEGTNDEIGEELKIDKEWLTILARIDAGNDKSILIFDAYDTAKDEKLKSNIIRAIKKSIVELSNTWRIVVSVRTYDAIKSRKLLELFPTDNINNQVSCRNFQIPALTEQEVEEAFDLLPGFESIYQKSNIELKKLLKTPYFLNMFYYVLIGKKGNFSAFNSIESEEQLLNVFWISSIEDSFEKGLFLRNLTLKLAESGSLSYDKFQILEENHKNVFNDLISSGILEEVSVMKKKIAFTHNILLDFAISKYLLKEDINEQVNYVANNEKMPFIFRQSFIYFYTKLYKEHNYLFWDHYFKIVQEESPLFRLLHQTTLIYVLVNCYSSVEDLNIIFQETDIDKKGQIVKKLLEGIRFLNRGNIREKDVDLLLKVSTCLHVTNVWEVNSLITISIEQYFLSEQLNVIKSLSDASCNCFDFVWENRKDVNSRDVLDHNGGVKAIDNIIKTLPFNIEKAQKFFNNILSLLNEEDFPIGYFYQLSDNIVLIYNHDKELATSIYKSLYFHTERSEKGTNLGNGVVLSLRSNRKQDYGMVHYALEEKFKEFLKLDFDFALALGIDIYNAVNDLTANKLYQKVNFEIGKSKFEICSDYSRYDYDSSNGPSSYINKILDEIGQNLNTKNTIRKGIEQLKRLMPLIKHAMVWRRVFQLLRRSPEKTKLIAFQLLSKREIYLFDELVYEAGELITAVWLNLTYLQKEKIEKIILSLHLDNPSSIIVSRIIQLINCIPTGQTTTKAAEEILADNMKVPNEPMVYEGNILADVSYSSREEKAKWSGFNVDDKDDDVLYKKIEDIESFTNFCNNSKELPSKSKVIRIAKQIEDLYSVCNKWSGNRKTSTELEIARFLNIFSKLGKQLTIKQKFIIKKIALQYVRDINYLTKDYESGELNQTVRGYGPNAKNVSVLTLLRLMSAFKDKEIEDWVILLMSDNEQIVRYHALKGLKYFWNQRKTEYWNIIKNRCIVETDGMCFNEILLAVYPHEIIINDKENVEDFCLSVMERLNADKTKIAPEIWKVLVVIILKLIIYEDSSKAKAIVYSNINVNDFCRSLIFEITKVIDPYRENNDYIEEPEKYKGLIIIILDLVKIRYEKMRIKNLDQDSKYDDFKIIDHLIQQLYYTVCHGKVSNKDRSISANHKLAFYKKIKPLISCIVEQSVILDNGYMVAHTGYYFMQMLNDLFELDPEDILDFSNKIVLCSSKSGFTSDRTTLGEIIKLTELIITDYKEILYKKNNFSNLISILDHFSNSGWQEAMEMTWRLKEAF